METLFYVISAFILGAGHALEPGHGKTIVGAYLVGSRRRVIEAILLGVIVTITHTAGVFALGAVALFAATYFRPQEISRFLQLPSGLLVLGVGLFILCDVWRNRSQSLEHGSEHEHAHGHEHSRTPVVVADAPAGLGLLVTLGVSGGLIPCPTALALLLAAIGAGQTAAGLIYVIAFSIGLTIVLVVIGLMMIGVRSFTDRRMPGPGLARWARLVSGLLVTAIGLYMVAQAIPFLMSALSG